MIGLHFEFDSGWAERDPSRAERFAAALSVGLGPAAAMVEEEGAILAAPAPNGARSSGFRRRRLATPRSPDGARTLFTGRIDNRTEALAELELDDSAEDAELYGHAYSKWGDACDLKLVGRYAAIQWWPATRTARLSRSPIDAPPLLIWRDSRRAAVASSANAIFACDVERRVDELKIADTLFLNYDDAERSFYMGLTRLPSGMQATLNADGLVTRRYWDIDALDPVRLPRDEDYVAAAEEIFRQATRAALAGSMRPGLMLSGGLDSQAVAAFALEEMPADAALPAFTSVPEAGAARHDIPGRFGDERAHVEAFVGMHPRVEVEFLESRGLDFEHRLDSLLAAAGAPPRNVSNIYWIHECHEHARARGCDVLLHGSLGNLSLSFGGERAYAAMLRQGRWLRLAREIRRGASSPGARLRLLRRAAIRPNAPRALQRAFDLHRNGRAHDPLESWCPLSAEYATEMQVERRAREMGFDPWFRPLVSNRQVRSTMLGGAMQEAGDIHQGMERLHGIPMRDPTAWRPFVEFCAALPDEQFLKDGVNRRLARRMLAGRLPPTVLNERRRGQQAADWAHRLAARREATLAELDRMARDPQMARRLDLPRLRGALADWDGEPPAPSSPLAKILQVALPRGLATARFIRQVEGRNDG